MDEVNPRTLKFRSISRLSVQNVPHWCFWCALFVGTVYQSYRYPLQYNFSGTSPTYSDTPVVFQLVKFLVIGFFGLLSAPFIVKTRLRYRSWLLVCLVVALSIYPIFRALGAYTPGDVIVHLETAFWPLAALVLVLAVPEVTIRSLDRYFRFVFFYALASNAIEVFLFLAIGRLPALAYENSFSVRFGGFLDDPNGFAALLYLLMGWSYFRFSGARRIYAQSCLVLCILLTQSLTAIAFLVLLALWFVLIRRPKPILLACFAALLTAFIAAFWSPIVNVLTVLSEGKSDSVSTHISQVTSTSSSSALDWILGKSTYVRYESWWVSSVVNYGIFWAMLCFGIILTLVFLASRALRRARGLHTKAILSGVLLYSCYFCIGNFNLPLFEVFPVNFIFFVLAFLLSFKKLALESAAEHVYAGDSSVTTPYAKA